VRQLHKLVKHNTCDVLQEENDTRGHVTLQFEWVIYFVLFIEMFYQSRRRSG
jgi:hypothetical protein